MYSFLCLDPTVADDHRTLDQKEMSDLLFAYLLANDCICFGSVLEPDQDNFNLNDSQNGLGAVAPLPNFEFTQSVTERSLCLFL